MVRTAVRPRPTPARAAVVDCRTCSADLAFMLTAKRPNYEALGHPVRIVDLFSGGEGSTWRC